MIKIQIPATSANLGAGFDALGLAVNLHNVVYMEESDTVSITALDNASIPTDESNLIYVSAKTVYELCGSTLKGLHIKQENNIPMTRGLGSSSACIIAGLAGANQLLGNPMDKESLVNLAATIEGHPDNTTPALLGGIVTAAIDHEQVYWVKQEVEQELQFLAVVPDFEMETEAARRSLPKQISHAHGVYNLSRAALFSASLLQGKYENLRVAVKDRLHQPYRLNMITGGKDIIKGSYEFGAYACYISGAGPTIMCIVGAENQFFKVKMRERLDALGYSAYQILELAIDNEGTKIFSDE